MQRTQTEPGWTKEAHFGVRNAQNVWEQECWVGIRRGLHILSDFTNPIIRQILMDIQLT